MKTAPVFVVSLLVLSLGLAGCPDPKRLVVVNQNTDNVSAVDYATGTVTSNLGGMAIGPVANRVVIRGAKAYVVNSGGWPGSSNASVEVINLSTNAVVNTIPLPDGENPWAIAFVSDTKAYVTTLYGNNITILNPSLSGAPAVLGTIALPVFDGPYGTVPAGPEGIVISGGYAYTANTAWDGLGFSYLPGSVSVIDTATDTLVDVDGNPANGTDTPIYTSQINPQDLDVDTMGQINVVCSGNYWSEFGVVDVIDPTTWSVTDSIPVGGSPGNISVLADWGLLGAGDADSCDVYALKTNNNSVVHDSANPFTLMSASGWCTVGKIALSQTQTGLKAFVPAGVWAAEARLFELTLAPTVQLSRTFDLVPTADLPAAVGVVY